MTRCLLDPTLDLVEFEKICAELRDLGMSPMEAEERAAEIVVTSRPRLRLVS
jgi:hypothetical protein